MPQPTCENGYCTNRATAQTLTGQHFCATHYRRAVGVCAHCGCEANTGRLQEIEDVGQVCNVCREQFFCYSCYECSETILRSDAVTRGGQHFCENCADTYSECEECHSIFNSDGVAPQPLSDRTLCRRCYRNEHRASWEPSLFNPTNERTFMGSSRKYGIEIETSDCPNHRRLRGHTVFGAKEDGSVDGMEFISPPMIGDGGIEEVRKFCQFSYQNNFEIDAACGFHVHINLDDVTEYSRLYAVALAYLYTEDMWMKFVSPSRRRNYFCTKVEYGENMINPGESFGYFVDRASCDGTRYNWVNWKSWNTWQTVEIRLHSPTLNFLKISNWVRAHARFVDFILDINYDGVKQLFRGLDDHETFKLVSEIWDDEALTKFYFDRALHFGTDLSVASELVA